MTVVRSDFRVILIEGSPRDSRSGTTDADMIRWIGATLAALLIACPSCLTRFHE